MNNRFNKFARYNTEVIEVIEVRGKTGQVKCALILVGSEYCRWGFGGCSGRKLSKIKNTPISTGKNFNFRAAEC